MELWGGTLPDFVHEAQSGSIVGQMLAKFYNLHGGQPSESEVHSWEFSLRAMAEVVHEKPRRDVGVAVEYHLPLSGKRIDVMFLGRNLSEAKPTALVVELKQWSSV